jgi:uncharacterized membrane protein
LVLNPAMRRLSTIILLLTLLVIPAGVYGQEPYSIKSTDITVFRDGIVQVKHMINVNETELSISLTLLSSSTENLLVLDQDNIPLSYDIAQGDISITTLGATKVTLEYLVSDLTKKEGSIWNFKVDIPYDATILLPEGSNIIYLSDMPLLITAKNNCPLITVSPDSWEIAYTQAMITPTPTTTSPTTTSPTTTSPTTTSPTTTSPTTTSSTTSATTVTTEPTATSATTNTTLPPPVADEFPVAYVAIPVVVAALVGVVLFLRQRRIQVDTLDLRPEDRDVLQFISEKGGKVLESELRQRFALPKSSMWRLAKRLERMGYVKISKVGIQNEIELVKKGI